LNEKRRRHLPSPFFFRPKIAPVSGPDQADSRRISPLEKHFQKVVVILGKILVALAAKEFDLPEHLGLVAFLDKAAIFILEITGGQDNPVGDLKEIGVVAAVRATDARPAFGGNPAGGFHFGFHAIPRQKKGRLFPYDKRADSTADGGKCQFRACWGQNFSDCKAI
jgi:hypothetical protein